MMAMAGVAMEEDLWWYVCTVCHQAFNDDLQLRVHKRQAHPSVRSACALILSQAADLNPIVKVSRCTTESLAIRFTPGDDELNEQEEDHHDADSDLSIADDDDEEIDIKEEFPGNLYTQVSEAGDRSCVITESTDTDDKEADPEIETDGDPGLCKLELEPEAGSEDQIQPDSIHINSTTDDGGTNEFLQKLRPRRSLRVRNIGTFTQQTNPGSDNDHEDYKQPSFSDISDSACSSETEVKHHESDSDWERVDKKTSHRFGKRKRYQSSQRQRRWFTGSVWAREMLDSLSGQSSPFRCTLCCKLFLDLASLKKHLNTSSTHDEHGYNMDKGVSCDCLICYKDSYLCRTPNGMWQCKLCHKTMREYAIKEHIQVTHPDEKVSEKTSSGEWRTAKLMFITTPDTREGTTRNNIPKVGAEVIQARATKDSRYECTFCGMTYSKQCIRRHIKEKHGSISSRKCSLCDKVFSSNLGLNKHHRTAHAITTKDHLCSSCGATFKTNTELKMHQRYHDPANKTYKCDVCGRSFFTSSILNTHRRTHDTRSKMCPICGKMFKGGKDFRHHHKVWHTDEAARFKCDKCDGKYKTLTNLQRHAGAHVDGTPVECAQCPKRFKTELHLKDHVNNIHLGKGPAGKLHFCRVCSQQFPGVVTVVQHELEAHNFQRPSIGTKYECHACNKKFGKKFSFEQHQRSHSDVRNFKCDTCDEAFKSKAHLRQHESTHLAYEELPHVCETCGKRFGKPAQLRNHNQRIHDKAEAEKVTTAKRKRD